MLSRARHLVYAVPLLSIPLLQAEPRPLQALDYTPRPAPRLVLDKMSRWVISLRLAYLMMIILPTALLWPLSTLSRTWQQRWCRLLKNTLELMGPCFVKLGQYTATRNDLLPEDVCTALSELHGAVTPHSFAYTKRIIEQELGEPLHVIFESLDPTPLGSGSIAQVHRGVLRSTGQVVAVKVCHPGVRESIMLDYKCVQWIARVASPFASWMYLPEQAQQFGLNLALQVDLRKEAENLELFNSHFHTTTKVGFPVPYVSTPRVLIESLEVCEPIEEYYAHKPPPIKPLDVRAEVAKIGVEAYFQMIITDNLFHCDLHPGNMKFREAATGNTFVLLDTAIVQSLTQQEQLTSVNLMLALMQKDGAAAARALLDMDSTKQQRFCLDPAAFTKRMEALIRDSLKPREHSSPRPWFAPKLVWDRIAPVKEKYADIGELLRGALNLVREYRVRVDPAFASLLFSTILLADMASKVDPDFDLLAHGSSWFFYSALGGIKKRV